MVKRSKPKLKAEKRKIIGRKVKALRQEGLLPANIYGKKVKSQAVQLDLKSFLPVYQEVGETGVVELQIRGDPKIRPVLIHNVQLSPVTDQPVHADFYQVSLKEKVATEIPIELIGESPAVKEKLGVLIQPLAEVEVEALPTELPDKFQVEIGQLKKVDDAFVVGDLKTPKEVKILTDSKEILAKIEPLAKEEKPVEEEAPEEVSAEEGEAAESGEFEKQISKEKKTIGKESGSEAEKAHQIGKSQSGEAKKDSDSQKDEKQK